jgi:anaerobic selenocysteine-containing dehydrogenase
MAVLEGDCSRAPAWTRPASPAPGDLPQQFLRLPAVRGDDGDPFSRGFICAKGVAIAEAHHDPDRLRSPVMRLADGRFEPVSWREASALACQLLRAVRAASGPDAVHSSRSLGPRDIATDSI